MKIIPAEEYYIPGIVELWKEFADFLENIDPYFARRSDGHLHFESVLKSFMRSEDHLVLIAVDAGQVAAYSISSILQCYPMLQYDRYGEIQDFAVKAVYRKKGIGGQMLPKIYAWFRSKEIVRIELRVAVENKIGCSFWKKHGFKPFMHVLYLPGSPETDLSRR